MTNTTSKITNIRTTKTLIVSSEIGCVYRYKHNQYHFYQFTKDWRCFNILTEKELNLVSPNNGRCFGFNIGGKFISLTKIKQNVEPIKTHKVRATADDVFTLVCKRFNTTTSQLKGKSRQNDLDLARQILAMLLYEFVVRSKKVVAALMNRKSMDSTFELIEKGQSQLNIDKVLANHYYSIKEKLEK
jgi:hypothetical protein